MTRQAKGSLPPARSTDLTTVVLAGCASSDTGVAATADAMWFPGSHVTGSPPGTAPQDDVQRVGDLIRLHPDHAPRLHDIHCP